MLTLNLGRRSVRLHSTAALSGLLLLGMGGAVIAIAFTGPSMPSQGWQLQLSATLQHWAHEATVWIGRGPTWAATLLILVALVAVVWRSLAQASEESARADEPVPPPSAAPPRPIVADVSDRRGKTA